MLAAGLAGCRAQLPDVPADAARLTGLKDAISFHDAADPPTDAQGETLTVGQAIRRALSRDPRIQSSLAKVLAAEADANQARLLPNPILTIDIRFPIAKGSNTAFEPSLTADLLSLLQRPARISAADKRLRESGATALITVLDVMSEVQDAYQAARTVDAEIDTAQRRQQRLRRLRDLAQERLDAGEATRLDVLTLDAQLMQAALALDDLRLQRVQERLILARLVGQPRSSGDWKLTPWQAPPDVLAPESAWIDAALRNRPDISQRVWELRALGDDLALAGLLPLQGGDMGVHAEHDPDWRVGPVLTTPLPIFDFGQVGQAKVRALRLAARQELVELRREVVQDVRLAYATYLQSRNALAVSRNQLFPLQQAQLEQAQLSYQAGEADLATLLLAENELDLTGSKIVELQEKLTAARVKLQRAAGGAGVAARVDAAQVRAMGRAPRQSTGTGKNPMRTTPAESLPASRPTAG